MDMHRAYEERHCCKRGLVAQYRCSVNVLILMGGGERVLKGGWALKRPYSHWGCPSRPSYPWDSEFFASVFEHFRLLSDGDQIWAVEFFGRLSA